MKKVFKFTIISLIFSLLLAYLASFFTRNENILAFFYSLGVFVTLFLLKGGKSLKFEKISKNYLFLLLSITFPLLINICLYLFESGFKFYENFNGQYFRSIIPLFLILAAAFFEESGWRGYIFDQLKKCTWLQMNLIISSCWALWHLPLIVSGYADISPPVILSVTGYLVNFFILSLVFGWLRAKTGGILAPALLHASLNFSGLLFIVENTNNISYQYEIRLGLIFILIILLLRAWKKPK